MSVPPELWTAVGTVLSAVAVATGTVAAARANRAAKNSSPVANGFTETVLQSLADIRTDVREIRDDFVEHLRDHAAGGGGKPDD